jgi:hypothetical protein
VAPRTPGPANARPLDIGGVAIQVNIGLRWADSDGTGAGGVEVVVRSNNLVRLHFLECLLRDAGIECDILDGQMSAVEGGIGAIPRPAGIVGGHDEPARRVLAEAGEA